MNIKKSRFKQLMIVMAVFSLVFIFFVAIPRVYNTNYPIAAESSLQAGIYVNTVELVDIACNDKVLSAQSQSILMNHSYRNSVSFRYFRTILIACILAGKYVFVYLRLLWVSEKATTRSQKSIIQFIHNKDGQKG